MNRSIWLDEAMLSNNIINRSFLELLQPLDNRQIAPIGFILVQKIFITVFGVSEYSLRAFPTITGIISIICFYFLFKKIGGEKFACTGLLFFIFGKLLIYHSTEAKQYYIDVAALVLSYYFLYFRTTDIQSSMSILLKALLGGVLIWFSHCSIFFLVSIGLALSIKMIYKCNPRDVIGFCIIITTWLLSFIINYYFFIYHHSSQEIQESAFNAAGYLPPAGTLINKIRWFLPIIKQSITYSLNFGPVNLFIVLMIIGLLYIIRRKEFELFVMLFPFFIHIVLSFLNIYPFGGRFNLYISTTVILLISLGLRFIYGKIDRLGPGITFILIIYIIYYPAKKSFQLVEFEEMKPVLKHILNHKNENDIVYIHFASVPAFQFYNKYYPLGNSEIVEGTAALKGFELDFHKFENKPRVWIVMTHWDENDRKIILDKCNQVNAKQLDKFEYNGGLTYLFSLKE